jgi:leucyl aminopeptidase (aminopeptidase T)
LEDKHVKLKSKSDIETQEPEIEIECHKACRVLLTTCSDCKPHEKIVIVTDPTSFDVARVLWSAAEEFPNKTIVVMDERTMHGQDPNPVVAAAMATADVIFGATKFSLFHSRARREAVAGGARFVNMVDYTIEMLRKGGLHADFIAQGEVCRRMGIQMLGEKIHIATEAGTEITASIQGRATVPQYGRSLVPGASSSPPDIECAIGAIEGTANGVIIVDGSIPHPQLGLIHDEIKLLIKDSVIVDISGGPQARTLARILKEFGDPNAYIVGEIGIGLNTGCELNGRMLEDEGCAGTMHFGFGSNTGFHGKIESAYHLDMVIRKPSIDVDGRFLLREGTIVITD